ncbi:MAG: putative DNA-binding domain-containing protein [Waddliaceae bacterium]
MNENKFSDKLGEIPTEVKNLQEWFASVIIRPVTENEEVNPISPRGNPIKKEAEYYISPSNSLKPHQRIEIYNKQYWWRLINFMQKNFPLTLSLLGYTKFEKITIQYLMKYPPDYWSLTVLGRNYPEWIKENNELTDGKLIFDAAQTDLYFYLSSITTHFPSISKEAVIEENFLNKNIKLQPHVFLLKSSYDLLNIREIIINNDPEYSKKHSSSMCQKNNLYYVIFRNMNNNISWKKVRQAEYLLLGYFKEGVNILEACDWIKSQDSQVQETMMNKFHIWIQSWTQLGWLTLSPVVRGQT